MKGKAMNEVKPTKPMNPDSILPHSRWSLPND
jgi:hypothetical protein